VWPWEHLAFGYLLFALGTRARSGRPPSDRATIALAVGTQLPDLVDKPLAWWLGVLPSGISLAHSIFFALPLTAAVAVVAARRGERPVGVAFAVGYLSHIAGDGIYPLAVSGDVSVGYMLWPLVPTAVDDGPFLATVDTLWVAFVGFLGTPRGRLYLAVEVLFMLLVVALWLYDGGPGLRVRRRVRG
jgi:hypothetical protein